MWKAFLVVVDESPLTLCHPFVDFQVRTVTSETLMFYSDASLNKDLGFGAIFDRRWIVVKWNKDFITES